MGMRDFIDLTGAIEICLDRTAFCMYGVFGLALMIIALETELTGPQKDTRAAMRDD